jgi:hypothetical protein
MKLEGKMTVWVSNDSTIQRVLNGTIELDDLHICSADMSAYWTKVGETTVVIDSFQSEEEMRNSAAAVLREQIRDKEAAHYMEMQHLNDKLQSLLAIAYTGDNSEIIDEG